MCIRSLGTINNQCLNSSTRLVDLFTTKVSGMFCSNICPRMDSNCKSLELEATTLPTVPQSLHCHRPVYFFSYFVGSLNDLILPCYKPSISEHNLYNLSNTLHISRMHIRTVNFASKKHIPCISHL